MKPLRHRPPTSTWCRPGHQLAPNHRRALAAPASQLANEPPSPRESDEQAPHVAHLRMVPALAPPAAPSAARPVVLPALRHAYGSRTRGVEDLTLLVAQLLDVVFVFRDSSTYGEHYDYHGPGSEKIEIKQNVEDDDGRLMEPAYPAHRSFIYISQSPRAQAIARAIATIDDVEHLHCELIDET